jgi:hypothetical protein
MGYGGGSGGYGSGGSGYGSGSGYAMPANPYDYQASSYVSSGYDAPEYGGGSGVVLKALGMPVEQGQLAWPIGLQALRPDGEVKSLRDQIDGLLQLAAFDRMNGRDEGPAVDQTKKAVARLRVLLRTNGKDRFYATTYQDAARFLDQLERGLKVLR